MKNGMMKLSVFLTTIIMLSFGQNAKAAEELTDEQIIERARENMSAEMWIIQPAARMTDRDFPYFPCFYGSIDWSKGIIERKKDRVSYELDVTENVLQTFVPKESLAEYDRTGDARYVFNSVHYIYEANKDGERETDAIMVVVPSKEYVDSGRLGMGCTDWEIEPNFSGYIVFLYSGGLFSHGREYRYGEIVSKYEKMYFGKGKDKEKLRLEKHIGKIRLSQGENGEVKVTTIGYDTIAGTCYERNKENVPPYKKTITESGYVKYESVQDSITSGMQLYRNEKRPFLFGTIAMDSYGVKAVNAIRKFGLSAEQIKKMDLLGRPKNGSMIYLYFDQSRKLRKVSLWVKEDVNKIIESEQNGIDRLWRSVCSVRLPAIPYWAELGDKYLYYILLTLRQVDRKVTNEEIEKQLPVVWAVVE